jgi:transketolase
MLNPALHLNEKLFEKDVEQVPTRNGFGDALVELGKRNSNVVVLSADLTESTRCEAFAKQFPDRFIEIGVAEQNMAAVAAGLGVTGKCAFIASYATFNPGKNWDTIRTTAVYNRANVKIAGHHAGIVTGPDGATHQATEDIAIMRCLPDIIVLSPCDAIESAKATIASAATDKPVYLRFTRDKTPVITTDKTPFIPGKIAEFWQTDQPEATIFATGYMLYYALLAANQLEKDGINVNVANVPTIKPLDTKSIATLTKVSRAVVTVEDHQVNGGLGSAIAEVLSRTTPLPMEYVGLQDMFAESGTPQEIRAKYHMDTPDIIKAVKKVIERKSN